MADIELVIKIDEEQYKFIKQSMTMDKVKDYHALLYDICEHIANGTPLDDLKKEIDKESVMHMDGEIYVRNIDVKRILGKTETR